jgi:transposase
VFLLKIDFSKIHSYTDGKAGFMVGLFEEMNLGSVFDKHLTKPSGRPWDIPYGILAQMMLVNMADDHHPLSRLAEYYAEKDIGSLFGLQVSLSQLNDDRFGGFLDLMHEAGPGVIFSEISSNAFIRYGITVKNINFDTTSKIMWGKYETEEGTEGVIHIDYGYSKQKRGDKKQIKISLGTGNGIVVDGQVLSGNMDDKTYNKDNLDRISDMLKRFGTEKDDFYYIADSAAFSKECLEKANKLGIHMITRMCDHVKVAKAALAEASQSFDGFTLIEIEKTKGTSRYHLKEDTCTYQGIPLKMAICYSEELVPIKEKSINRWIEKEYVSLSKIAKNVSGRQFACLTDAEIEGKKLLKKDLKKLKYHQVNLTIQSVSVNRQGRPFLNPEKNTAKVVYSLTVHIKADIERISAEKKESCIFVLCCTDLRLSGEEILREYKTQSSVEKKFQQLKSPQFVNSLYVESPERVEALGYLMMICLMVLSVAEHVVRRGLKEDNDFIIGPGKVKMTKPSLHAIYSVFYAVKTVKVMIGSEEHRGFSQPLRDNVQKIMKYLGIPQDIFIRGTG